MELHMQILLIAAAAAVAVFHAPPARGRITRSEAVLVRFVFDGDTIDVATVGRVRLLGIDAPETGRGFETPAPFGREARARLSALVLRRWVRLEYEGPPTDSYNRRLAYVLTEDGQFVNVVLVREGLARVSARSALMRLRELQRAQAEAQAARRGIWGRAPRIAPAGLYSPVEGRPASSVNPSRTNTPSGKRWTTRTSSP
jgi:micrococcal nuclease